VLHCFKMSKKKLYWLSQTGGWIFFIVIETVSYASIFGFNKLLLLNGFLNFIAGIALTHAYRAIILKLNLLKLPTAKLIPRSLILIVFISVLLSLFNIWLDRITVPDLNKIPFGFLISGYLFNWSKYILLWALIYHLFQYWEKSLEAERDKYRLEVTLKENQFNNLKTQLNPHFLFNALNGVRTLVDINPTAAKEAITKLSNLLRSSLHMSNYKTVSLRQELETVKDYLDIETLRFDDRLQVNYQINPSVLDAQIPPMMLQTLVENAVKHGIAKLKQGGSIVINAYANNYLNIEIINSGILEPANNNTLTGYGIKNTKERLELLYNDNFQFSINTFNNNKVITKVKIPL